MLSIEQKALVEALGAELAQEKFNIANDVDQKALFVESVHQAVALCALTGIDSDSLNVEVKSAWQEYAMRMLSSNTKIHAQHALLHSLMQEASIPYVILKGSVSAFYYPDPLMRAMGDVDFLIKEEDVERATEFLLSKGFVQQELVHICHLVFKKGKMHLEMHFAPAGMPDGKAGEIMEEYLKDIFDNSKEVEICGSRFVKPSDFHHGLILLMHTYHHLLSEGVGLRHLCDWATFVNSFEGEDFALTYKDKLEKIGLWEFAIVLSYISYKHLGVAKKEWMGEPNEELCNAILEDIFSGGNFGNKDENRSVEGYSISNRGKGGIKRSKFFQLLSNLNKAGQTKYPKMAKIPIIKYFCIIPIGFRYTFRVLTGKRKRLKFVGAMKQAEKRKQIYKQLNLYEIKEN